METFAAILTAILFWAFVANVTIGNRRTARETAGELLVTASRMSYGDWFVQIFLGIMPVALFVCYTIIYFTGLWSGYMMPSWMVFMGAFITLQCSWFVVMRPVASQTEFRHHGIIPPQGSAPSSFIPWSHILFCKLFAPGRKLMFQVENYTFEIKIDPKKIEQINTVLVDHVDTRDPHGKTINADRLPFEYPNEPQPIKRRRLQFNIKTALLFMVVASSAFAWLGIHLQDRWREQEALTQLEEFGAKINYRDGRIIGLDFSEGTGDLTDENLRHLTAFKRLNSLNLTGTPITDAGLAHIEKLSSLTSLYLNETKVTDAGLTHIANMTTLGYLHLDGANITDDGLVHIKHLTRLKWLGLGRTKITDAGLAHIEPLTRLEWLSLDATKITDAGIARLSGLTRLKHLHLGRTQVTDAGMVHLKPLTKIEWLDLHLTQVTDAGLVHLEGFEDLQDLVYYSSKITLEGTQRLKEKQPRITAY